MSTTRTLRSRGIVLTHKLKTLTKEQIENLPKYVFPCTSKNQEDGCNEKTEKMNQFIIDKYERKDIKDIEKYKAFKEKIKKKLIRYIKNNEYMCYNQDDTGEDKGGLMTASYLIDTLNNPKYNALVLMDNNNEIPHSVITYHYDVKRKMVYIPSFCTNQIEMARGGTIHLNILKEACKHAGIKNIILDSVPGAVPIYKYKGFDSDYKITPASDKELKRMTLKSPLNKSTPRTPSINTHLQSFTPQTIKRTISKRSNNIELKVDNLKREFEMVNEPNIENIMTSINSPSSNKTLFDLENNKEYILVDNNLYSPKKSFSKMTKRMRSSTPKKKTTQKRRIQSISQSRNKTKRRLT
jgi:hypothetical protein